MASDGLTLTHKSITATASTTGYLPQAKGATVVPSADPDPLGDAYALGQKMDSPAGVVNNALPPPTRKQRFLDYHRHIRSFSLDRDTQFSWIRCGVFLGSYLLLLTDMFRTTMAIRQIQYTQLEPNAFMSFGPYGYPVNYVLWNATTDQTAPVWSYKYDTTSVAIRSVAQFFNLTSWLPCILRKFHCEGTMIGYPKVFGMLDSLVDSVSQRKVRYKDERPGLTLRTENVYYDRVSDYILPCFFQRKKLRTVQALYYDTTTVASARFEFCARGTNQPYTCGDNWVNSQATCATQNAPCLASRLIWKDIMRNTRTLVEMNPDFQLDMLLIEGYEDRGLESFSLQGRQQFDISIVTRIRNCTHGVAPITSRCTTVAVNDYRYEGESLSTNILEWYYVVYAIRILGQSYAYLRIAFFSFCCYRARSAEPELLHASTTERLRATLRTMFTAPSQVIAYGAVPTVFAYTIAHLMDSSMVYAQVFDEFTSLAGKFHLDIRLFVQVATISMRSLWILATAFHIILFLRTRGTYSPANKGIPGIPEFTLSATAFLTVSAQYRSLSFRDCTVTSIMEVIPSYRARGIRASRYDNTRHIAHLFVLGDTLDAKTLAASLVVVTGCAIAIYGIAWTLSKHKVVVAHELTLWPHSIVSYAAGNLWPLNALMVSWEGFVITPVEVKRYSPVSPAFHSTGNVSSAAVASSSGKAGPILFIVNRTEESRMIQNAIANLDGRSAAVNATLYLMNLTVMSDPIVLMCLYWFGGYEIGVYKSTRKCDQLFFLPFEADNSEHLSRIDSLKMEFLVVVNTMDLPWPTLLQCG